MNIRDFFSPTYEFYLDNIDYTHKTKSSTTTAYTLNCVDNLSAQMISDSTLQVKITRKLEFTPDDLYSLSVTFIVLLQIVDEKNEELASLENLSMELVKGGHFFLSDIMSRISALISDITASFGQPPVVTPPSLVIIERTGD